MIRLPIVPGLREQRLELSLDGTRFVVRVEWMERVGAWYLHLATAADEPIATGLRVFGRGYVLGRLADDRRPGGQILSLSSTDPDRPPGFADMGNRTRLFFATWAELEQQWGLP